MKKLLNEWRKYINEIESTEDWSARADKEHAARQAKWDQRQADYKKQSDERQAKFDVSTAGKAMTARGAKDRARLKARDAKRIGRATNKWSSYVGKTPEEIKKMKQKSDEEDAKDQQEDAAENIRGSKNDERFVKASVLHMQGKISPEEWQRAVKQYTEFDPSVPTAKIAAAAIKAGIPKDKAVAAAEAASDAVDAGPTEKIADDSPRGARAWQRYEPQWTNLQNLLQKIPAEKSAEKVTIMRTIAKALDKQLDINLKQDVGSIIKYLQENKRPSRGRRNNKGTKQ
jgi:hypothetical protein